MFSGKPIHNSYWVLPGQLLAGRYPGGWDEAETCKNIRRFVETGITFFLDLTESHELPPYQPVLDEHPESLHYHRTSIRDMGITTPEHMRQILDTIDTAVSARHTVYVHCWGGIGRTGTVVGCYLVRHGMTGEEALRQIAECHTGLLGVSPETDEQCQMILDWKET
jgi:protein-tyrosine phosphatase